MGYLANSDEQDETQHSGCISSGSALFAKIKPSSGTETHYDLETSTCKKYTMDSHLFVLSICKGKSIRIQRLGALSLNIGVAPVR